MLLRALPLLLLEGVQDAFQVCAIRVLVPHLFFRLRCIPGLCRPFWYAPCQPPALSCPRLSSHGTMPTPSPAVNISAAGATGQHALCVSKPRVKGIMDECLNARQLGLQVRLHELEHHDQGSELLVPADLNHVGQLPTRVPARAYSRQCTYAHSSMSTNTLAECLYLHRLRTFMVRCYHAILMRTKAIGTESKRVRMEGLRARFAFSAKGS